MDSISLPQNTLVVLCGIAGCGKTTFAARHFARTKIVSSDECRALLCDDATNQSISPHAFDLLHFIIRKRLLLRRLTVADATNLKAEDRRVFLTLARRFRFRAALIAFDVPLETCLARNAARTRIVPADTVIAQYQLFKNTLTEIEGEGFDSIFILNEQMQSRTTIQITRPLRQFSPR